MAKVDIPGPPLPAPPRVRGAFYVRGDPKLGNVAQAWPTKYEEHKFIPYQKRKRLIFGIASHIASGASGLDHDTCQAISKGSDYTWRDLQIRAGFGGLYSFTDIRGYQWTSAQMTNPDPQYILDMVTDEVGSVLFRDTLGWFGLDPGVTGQVLTMQAGLPAWRAAVIGGQASPASTLTQIPDFNPTSASAVTFNYISLWPVFLPIGTVVSGVSTWAATANGSSNLQALLYDCASNGDANSLLASSSVQSGVTQGQNDLPFGTAYQVATAQVHYFGFHLTGSNLNVPLNSRRRCFYSTATLPTPPFSPSGNGNNGIAWCF